MVNVVSNYKLLDIEIDGKVRTEMVDTKEAWNVFEFVAGDKTIAVNEADEIEFVVENGEIKRGTIVKLSGKGEKTKIKIVPIGLDCEEIWPVMAIKDGTLKVIGSQDSCVIENDEDEEENDNDEA